MKMSRDGRITVPKQFCDLLGINSGSGLTFALTGDGRLTLGHPVPHMNAHFAKLRGCATAGMTTEQIMALTRAD